MWLEVQPEQVKGNEGPGSLGAHTEPGEQKPNQALRLEI